MGIVDKYVGIDLPTPDAKAAFALTGRNGPCRYVVKEDVASVVNAHFFVSVIAPNISRAFGNEIGILLGKALLYAIFECPERVPSSIVDHVTMEMDRLQISRAANPIQRVAFVVVQEDDQCVLHDIGVGSNGAAVSPVANVYNNAVAGSMDAVLTMMASI